MHRGLYQSRQMPPVNLTHTPMGFRVEQSGEIISLDNIDLNWSKSGDSLLIQLANAKGKYADAPKNFRHFLCNK